MNKKIVRFLVLGAALALLWFALRGLAWREIAVVLLQLTIPQVLTLMVLNTGIMLLLSVRWWVILRLQGTRVSYWLLSAYRLASFSVSYFTPGPHFGGEPLQVYLLKARHSLSTAAAVSSVSLDKLFDLLANFTFLVIGVIILLDGGLLGGSGPAALGVSLTLMLITGCYLLALRRGWRPLHRVGLMAGSFGVQNSTLRKFGSVAVRAEKDVSIFLAGSRAALAAVTFVSGLVWIALIAEYWLALRFLGLEISLDQVVSILTAARVAMLLPAPGAIGTLEASQNLAVQALGFAPAFGISISLLIRARDVSFGLVGLWLGSIFGRNGKV